MNAATETLAGYFAGVLRGWLTDSEWHEMRHANATDAAYIDDRACASHNYCDANMAMDAAWLAIAGRHADAGSDADSALWNRAWSIAKAKYLTGETTHVCDACTIDPEMSEGCEYTPDGADPTPGSPACGAPATVCNPHGLSGKAQRWFDYDEWYCAAHADPTWLTA